MHSLRKVILWDKISMLDLFPQFLTVICHSCKIAYIKKKLHKEPKPPKITTTKNPSNKTKNPTANNKA